MSKVAKTWAAHRTRRWHTNPHLAHIGQTLADHAHGVAAIIMHLHPSPSRALIGAALMHDAGEHAVGDIPAPAKSRWPSVMAHVSAVEGSQRDALLPQWLLQEWPGLTDEDHKWLHLADALEALMWAEHFAPSDRCAGGFAELNIAVAALAEELGVADRVQAAAICIGRGLA